MLLRVTRVRRGSSTLEYASIVERIIEDGRQKTKPVRYPIESAYIFPETSELSPLFDRGFKLLTVSPASRVPTAKVPSVPEDTAGEKLALSTEAGVATANVPRTIRAVTARTAIKSHFISVL